MHARQLVITFNAAQYLAVESVSEERHELVDGHILAMAGGSRLHSATCARVVRRLDEALSPGCTVFQSDMRVHVSASGAYFYPDAAVVCGAATGAGDQAIDNPTVVVEVLSPSTSGYDRGEKVLHYQRIPAARDLVLVDPDARRVAHWYRTGKDSPWQYEDRVHDVLVLRGCAVEIPVAHLFVELV
ncbi:MAG: Uma2 family endonuclease [Deltaproteobacteria bacterium]|nr:Uma2 family endonuclease [Deltaproteobacteria bacterium]